MHLNSGRIDDVAAIAGYVPARSSRACSVALLIDGKNVHPGSGLKIEHALVRALILSSSSREVPEFRRTQP